MCGRVGLYSRPWVGDTPGRCNVLHPYLHSQSRSKHMSMSFNNPNFWFFVLTICSIALLTEVSLLVHMLLMTRQRLWRYLLVVIPVAKCIWSFTVIWYTLNTAYLLLPYIGIHFSRHNRLVYIRTISPLVHALQLQIGILIASFTIMLFLERIALPRTDQPPVWTLTKDLLPGNKLRGHRPLLSHMDGTASGLACVR
jgi:hypothetical protein